MSTTWTTTRLPTTPASCGPSRWTRWWVSTPSSGEVFADRYGEGLSDLVSRLAGTTVAGTEVNTEGSARVDVLTEEQPPLVAKALRAGSADTIEQAHAEVSSVQAAVISSSASG